MDKNTELAEVALILDDCLERLDRVGAGIAAIHVNAALEHLAQLCPESVKRPGGLARGCDWILEDVPEDGLTVGKPGMSRRDLELLCRLDTTGRAH